MGWEANFFDLSGAFRLSFSREGPADAPGSGLMYGGDERIPGPAWETAAAGPLAWGLLAAMAVLAAGVVAVGVPWARRQRDARATSTSTP